MFCKVCGDIDPNYDEGPDIIHNATIKHICNTILAEFEQHKRQFHKSNEVIVIGGAEILDSNGATTVGTEMKDHRKIRIYIKPRQEVKFVFNISNNSKKEDLVVFGFQLGHPQPQFIMNDHPYVFGESPRTLEKKSKIQEEISVKFQAADIGQYEMPIMFTFHKLSLNKNIIIVREMVVMVEEQPMAHAFPRSPYTNEDLTRAEHLVPSLSNPLQHHYKIPRLLKILLPRGLEEKALEGIKQPREIIEQLRKVLIMTRAIFDEGITKDNYMIYFHHLLWWEEIIAKINLRKYNMSDVTIERRIKPQGSEVFVLEVPGLAEKRPSLLRGDRVFLQPKENTRYIFECVVNNIEDSCVHLTDVDDSFYNIYTPESLYDVRFIMSRVPMERSHEAVSCIYSSKQDCRLFPKPRKGAPVQVPKIKKFWNELIKANEEQRSAVEHIVAGTSGKAPYIVFGPPGTGKTMTIVEAIIQLVVCNKKNRILVCTDSNMAADHIALMLLKYNAMLNINNFILRASSQTREWTTMPAVLKPVSNGTSYENYQSMDNNAVSPYRIVVTTLLHAAKYFSARSQRKCKLSMSHLFIDEAAQASEPHTLVPITGLLAPSGQLVLAGDPQQLGPVCMSKEAYGRGLGTSLLERLKLTHDNLYHNDSNYITMLRRNFRNDPDILQIPNELFYNNELVALAPFDHLSKTSILGLPGGERAIVFHALNSREQRMGNAPSFFNEKELDMLKRYVKTLIEVHKVLPEDIGVIAPYIRQVYKMKGWLVSQLYDKIEVGTVEAFQGKEKRVILVSTVRANCRLLDYDAKYGLGFLVDDKRYNVTLTRAKAKLVIIGNPACLTRDVKWRKYMGLCKELESYFGEENQQLERNEAMLTEIAKTRFNRCGLTEALKEKKKEIEENKKKKGNRNNKG